MQAKSRKLERLVKTCFLKFLNTILWSQGLTNVCGSFIMCWSLRSQDSSCQFRKVGMEVTFKEIKITYREAGRKTAVNILMNSNSDHYGHQGCHISICFWTPAPDMFSSVTQSFQTLCNPKDCSTPGLPVHHQLPEFTQTHVHWVGDDIQPSHLLSSPSLPPSIFSSIRVFSSEWFFTSGGQSIGASASASVLPMNIQDWSPLGWSSWISLQSKGLLSVFSNTTVQKHQVIGAQLFL